MFDLFRRHFVLPHMPPGYGPSALRSDVFAALTVAIVALPQSMAYALIAGVEPVYGLYGTIVAAIVGSLFGSSSHLITGPTNAIALMVAGAMRARLGADDFYSTLFLLTFLVGGIQLLLGVLKAGKILNLVSHAVIVGFTAGAGIIIGLGQLHELLGVALPGGYHPLYAKVLLTLGAAGRANLWTVGLAALTVLIVLAARRIDRRIPGALVALVLCAVLARVLHLGDRGVRLVGDIPGHLPAFTPLHLDAGLCRELFGAALAIAVVGLVEAIAIAKSISLSSEQAVDAGREFRGQGLSNLVGALFGCFPSSGSFTRSAVNYSAGARSRLAGVLSGVFVALALVCCAAQARYLPAASLAGVIVVVAYGMVDQHAIGRIARASRHDLGVILVTAGATVLMPDLERAILTGIGVSIFVHLWNTGEIKVRLLRPHGAVFREHEPGSAGHGPVPVAIVHLDGNLYFGAAQDLQDKLREVAARTGAKVYVLRLKRVNVLDVSAFEVLEAFVDRAREAGRHVVLCGVSPVMARFLGRIGLAARIGEANIFPAEETLYASTQKAYRRALELLPPEERPPG
jgi:SulP family sulfate permease